MLEVVLFVQLLSKDLDQSLVTCSANAVAIKKNKVMKIASFGETFIGEFLTNGKNKKWRKPIGKSNDVENVEIEFE